MSQAVWSLLIGLLCIECMYMGKGKQLGCAMVCSVYLAADLEIERKAESVFSIPTQLLYVVV